MTSWSFYLLRMDLVYCIILVLYYYITMFVIHVVIKTVGAQFVSRTVLRGKYIPICRVLNDADFFFTLLQYIFFNRR